MWVIITILIFLWIYCEGEKYAEEQEIREEDHTYIDSMGNCYKEEKS